jgi:hypothetical protein
VFAARDRATSSDRNADVQAEAAARLVFARGGCAADVCDGVRGRQRADRAAGVWAVAAGGWRDVDGGVMGSLDGRYYRPLAGIDHGPLNGLGHAGALERPIPILDALAPGGPPQWRGLPSSSSESADFTLDDIANALAGKYVAPPPTNRNALIGALWPGAMAMPNVPLPKSVGDPFAYAPDFSEANPWSPRPWSIADQALQRDLQNKAAGSDARIASLFVPGSIPHAGPPSTLPPDQAAVWQAQQNALAMGPDFGMVGADRFSAPEMVPSRMSRGPTAALPSAQTLAARSPQEYNLPEMPQRRFDADYKNGVPEGWSDEAGNLKYTMDGDPIHARWVVGRKVVGGDDEAFPPEELNALATRLTGRAPENISRSDPRSPLQGEHGALFMQFAGEEPDAPYLRQDGITLADDLSPEAARLTLGHEIGHSIDVHAAPPETLADHDAGRFGTRPDNALVNQQLYRVYRDRMAPWREHFGPTDSRYTGVEAPAELWAEGRNAYLTNPNYMKTVAPDAAKVIRESWNSHPVFSRFLQFNALPPLAAGLGGAIGGALGWFSGGGTDESSQDPANRTY